MQHNLGHFGGGLHSQSLDWYWQTQHYRKNTHKLTTTQKSKQHKIQQTKPPGSVASYGTWPGTRWAYYILPSLHGAPKKVTP